MRELLQSQSMCSQHLFFNLSLCIYLSGLVSRMVPTFVWMCPFSTRF